ncbi:RNA polymerase alpha subunit C-terminal domain-containing protein [Mucilaginibacter sp.]|jgi:hypothetical protein|uniref:RNA polymerase alpha subunit C-terminal domain-containing protein n=1 Tax=Mucilaginibacter sp. TaxID=1882438 RepID=UPI002D124F2F|nr:RNA polymerase alpha subunit C-terminal domain-containing protein [Mucilaginibacter sp.]HTI61568.1 RNA polymerase alpha subunit C-terminal domain-containing protein [Mucilaginibacter sp.]
MSALKTLRTCNQGHQYYKSSDCPTCPVCENERKAIAGVFGELSAPAQRALRNSGILTPQQLATFTEKDVLKLHGVGPGSLPKLRELLKQQGLSFKTK